MKLPRFTPQTNIGLPRFKAAMLPAPRMISVRNERFIPEETGEQAYRAQITKDQPLVDLFKVGEQLWDVYAEVREKQADGEFESMKAEYKRQRTEDRLKVERGTPLFVDQYLPEDESGRKRKIGVTYPWQGAADNFQNESDTVAEGLHEGRDRRAVAKFEQWRKGYDTDAHYKLTEWEIDRTIDLYDYETDQAIENAVEDRNDTEVQRIIKEKQQTGFFDLQALNKAEEEAMDAIEKGRVYDEIDNIRITLDQRSPEAIMNSQHMLIGEAMKIQDDATRSKALKDILNLDEELATTRSVVWDENYWAVEAEVAEAETPEQEVQIYDKYLDRPDIEAALGSEKYTKLRENRDAAADNTIQTDPEIEMQLSEMISDYEKSGDSYQMTRDEIRSRQRLKELHPDDARALLKRLDDAQMKEVGKINSRLEKDLNGYLSTSTESTTGFSRLNVSDKDPEAEIRLLLERTKARDRIFAETRRRAADGTLEQWSRSGEATEFVYNQAMEAKQAAAGGTKESGTKGSTAVLTVGEQSFEGTPAQMGRKANTYIDKWEDHVANGGNESNWTGPTVEWNGQELVPSRDNINLLRKGQ